MVPLSSTAVRCIWCQKERSAWSIEHPIPESLGNTDLVLDVGVCRPCNNSFGGLDRALLLPFEMLTFQLGIPRKKGKKPTIDGWRGVKTRWINGHAELFVNAGPGSVDAPTGRLNPADKSSGIHTFKFPEAPVVGQRYEFGFKHDLKFDRKFTRGIYKSGLELLALQTSLDFVQDATFDRVRQFCRYDEGEVQALAIFRSLDRAGISTYYMEHGRPETTVCSFELFGIEFVCEFSSPQEYLEMLERADHPEAVGGAVHRIPY